MFWWSLRPQTELPAPLIQADVENLGKKERENIRVNFCEKFLIFLHIFFHIFFTLHVKQQRVLSPVSLIWVCWGKWHRSDGVLSISADRTDKCRSASVVADFNLFQYVFCFFFTRAIFFQRVTTSTRRKKQEHMLLPSGKAFGVGPRRKISSYGRHFLMD